MCMDDLVYTKMNYTRQRGWVIIACFAITLIICTVCTISTTPSLADGSVQKRWLGLGGNPKRTNTSAAPRERKNGTVLKSFLKNGGEDQKDVQQNVKEEYVMVDSMMDVDGEEEADDGIERLSDVTSRRIGDHKKTKLYTTGSDCEDLAKDLSLLNCCCITHPPCPSQPRRKYTAYCIETRSGIKYPPEYTTGSVSEELPRTNYPGN
eukprot:GHVQ01007983.1.p1 GENE.GHVQ01007983.1~~GHVQ01007983.1.p1  ORF type:complete len:207 (+),score=22.68 GHVQ01007983.1:76-696(+)